LMAVFLALPELPPPEAIDLGSNFIVIGSLEEPLSHSAHE
jgi:hypothetical protein